MKYAEIIVNVPIRRTFATRMATPPPLAEAHWEGEEDAPSSEQSENDRTSMQLYHYHLPVTLEDQVQAGHLVWVPFGRQQVQGVVVRLSDQSPVPTKPIDRLARAEPLFNATQLTLAAWIADRYVAPLSEALKLFIPPGLLNKDAEKPSVHVRRELRIELSTQANDAEETQRRIDKLGRETSQNKLLAHLLSQPLLPASLQAVASSLKSISSTSIATAIRTLQEKGVVELVDDQINLLLAKDSAQERLAEMRGIAKYLSVVAALRTADTPLWKSELYERVESDLETLRTLAKAGVITMSEQVRFRDPLRGQLYARTVSPPLTDEQAKVWEQVREGINRCLVLVTQAAAPSFVHGNGNGHATQTRQSSAHSASLSDTQFLLHGVTGSGKTEIYLRAIERSLSLGRQAIVLVPEIALTPQTVARFAGRFPGRVTVIHSELSTGERYDVWRAIRNEEFDIVIGPRSALFAPLPRLGLIVLDEEHESSYKQDSEAWGSFTVFYDARIVARQLALLTHSVLILGSATPSLEQFYATKSGELTLLKMPRRVLGHQVAVSPTSPTSLTSQPIEGPSYAELPPVQIVDMRQELRAGNRNIISRTLLAELQVTLDANEQSILFLNRRGAYTFVMCRDCGYVEACNRCDTPLVYHEQRAELICHHCNRRFPVPQICQKCQSKRIKYFGSGTQRIEEIIQQLLPQARVLRWDADTTSRKGSHAEILQRFAQHEADILVGTQMIAKGLDLPLVTLVGVIAADTGLHLPDFRSAERTFQLLMQVAGRAGRSERRGRVVIQSYTPQHYAIQAAAQHDYVAFFEREMAFRHEHAYPPIQRMARLIYWDKDVEKTRKAAESMAVALRHRLSEMGLEGKKATILGPAPAFFARFRGYYRWQLLIRAPNPAEILRKVSIPFGWRIDIDPMSVL